MSEQSTVQRNEPRWPVVLAILIVVIILEFLPGRLRVAPVWFPYVVAFILLAPMVGEELTHSKVLAWFERFDVYLFVGIAFVLMMLTLVRLIHAIVAPSPETEMSGIRLLASAIAMWVVNVIAFSLLYWEMDRGGPDMRASGNQRPPDILFPDMPPEVTRPFTFVDYFFFAFTTSTAFSPTETYPSTTRTKLLMILQSAISLALIVVVGARAINVLK